VRNLWRLAVDDSDDDGQRGLWLPGDLFLSPDGGQ
jgi:hypothetical protein